MILFISPYIIHAIIFFWDEFYFHYKRGLALWELIGHPIDTLSTALCLLFVQTMPFSEGALLSYCGLLILSCLSVSKDEAVHYKLCSPTEMWLHSLLFLLHPILLLLPVCIWSLRSHPFLQQFLGLSPEVVLWNYWFIWGILALTIGVLLYQLISLALFHTQAQKR